MFVLAWLSLITRLDTKIEQKPQVRALLASPLYLSTETYAQRYPLTTSRTRVKVKTACFMLIGVLNYL